MLNLTLRRSTVKATTLADISGFTLLDFLKRSSPPLDGSLKVFQGSALGWDSYAKTDLVEQVELIAAGLISLGLSPGDRIGFLLKSDVSFLMLDLACVQSSLVSVPLDLSQTIENIIFSLDHSETKVLFVSNVSILDQVLPYFERVPSLQQIILLDHSGIDLTQDSASVGAERSQVFSECHTKMSQKSPLKIPPSIGLEFCLAQSPGNARLSQACPFTLLSWSDFQGMGQEALDKFPQIFQEREANRSPHDLATLIYIPHEDGSLKGVMLSHENMTSTALAAFAGMKGLKWGDRESVVTFLPLTHIFARVMLYGHLYYRHRIYFSSPKRVMKDLQTVKPTILSTVPILIHRVFRKLQVYGESRSVLPISSRRYRQWPQRLLDGLKRRGHRWAMTIAQRPVESCSNRFFWRRAIEKPLAALVFRQWRGLLGGRLRYCLTGGAALDADIAQFFLNIGLPVYQGYGLTQTSSVVTFNHPGENSPETVGPLRFGADCAIASDGEVLVKGTGIMGGYFKDSEASSREIDSQGWFHTGDLGRFNAQNHLILVGHKKSLFKLTTGKYVTPLPLEAALERSPLVLRALVVGEERKYCAAILLVETRTLLHEAQKMGLTHYPIDALWQNPCIHTLYEALVHQTNCYSPYWSTIKRIRLLPASVAQTSPQSQAHSSGREALIQRYSAVIDELYQESSSTHRKRPSALPNDCHNIPFVSCPVTGQSLNTKLS